MDLPTQREQNSRSGGHNGLAIKDFFLEMGQDRLIQAASIDRGPVWTGRTVAAATLIRKSGGGYRRLQAATGRLQAACTAGAFKIGSSQDLAASRLAVPVRLAYRRDQIVRTPGSHSVDEYPI
jgi:hypothetical protein